MGGCYQSGCGDSGECDKSVGLCCSCVVWQVNSDVSSAGPRYRGASSSSQKQGRVILVTNLNEEVSPECWMLVTGYPSMC